MRVLWFAAGATPAVRRRLDITDLGNRNVWVVTAANALASSGKVDLGIVWASSLVREPVEFEEDGITYFCVPTGGRLEAMSNRLWKVPRLRKVWQGLTYLPRQAIGGVLSDLVGIADRFSCDVVHVHGTEGFYGLLAGRTRAPVIISLQGILQAVVEAYWGSVPLWRRPQFPMEMLLHQRMRRHAKRENRIITQGKYFTGRTDWDRNMLAAINPDARYYSDGARLLREQFYGPCWRLESSTRKRLYTTVTSRPYKGTDVLIDALAILSTKHPDVSLHIGGHLSGTAFGRFVQRRIATLGLTGNVEMLGFVEASDIVRELQAARAYVLGSYIENSPNSVAEAQAIGTPAVASDAGGTPSLVADGVSGLLYPAGDAASLARQVDRLFRDDGLAESLSRGGRSEAAARGGTGELTGTLLGIYRQVLADATGHSAN